MKTTSPLEQIRDILAQIEQLTDYDHTAPHPLMPEPDAITETMRHRFIGRATRCIDYRTGEQVPTEPNNATDPNTCPVIDLARGVSFYIRTPYISLTRDTHAQIVIYAEVFRSGSRFSGSVLIPLTPEAMPGIGQNPRPYWDNYPKGWHNNTYTELSPGARTAVLDAISDLVPPLNPDAIRNARIHALHKEAAAELISALGKAQREISNAIRTAATHATNAERITNT